MANGKSLLTDKEAHVILTEIKQVQAMSEEEFQACLETVRTADLPNKEERLDALIQMRAFDLRTVKSTGKGAKSSNAEGEKFERSSKIVLDPKVKTDASGVLLVNAKVHYMGSVQMPGDNQPKHKVDCILFYDDIPLAVILTAGSIPVACQSAWKTGKIPQFTEKGSTVRISEVLSANRAKISKTQVIVQTLVQTTVSLLKALPENLWVTTFKATTQENHVETVLAELEKTEPEMYNKLAALLD